MVQSFSDAIFDKADHLQVFYPAVCFIVAVNVRFLFCFKVLRSTVMDILLLHWSFVFLGFCPWSGVVHLLTQRKQGLLSIQVFIFSLALEIFRVSPHRYRKGHFVFLRVLPAGQLFDTDAKVPFNTHYLLWCNDSTVFLIFHLCVCFKFHKSCYRSHKRNPG